MIFARSESGALTGVVIFGKSKYPSKDDTSLENVSRAFYERSKKISEEMKYLERELENCTDALKYIFQK